MKLVWKQVTLGALLLLGSVAAMEKGGGDIGSSDGVSHLDCDDVDDVGSQHPLMNHQPSFLDAIKYFFGLDEEVKMTADNDRIDLKTKGVDSLPRPLGKIFKRPPFPPTPEVARDRPTPSTDPEEEVTVVGGKKVHKHYWPLPTDVEIGKQFEARVLVGFVGNPYNLSDEEKRELADAFTVTYNDLNEREGFTITSVRFIEDLNGIASSPSQRRLQDSLKDLVDYATNFTELLGITGECGDVCDNPRLFPKPDDVQDRQLAILSMAPHHYLRDKSFHRKIQEESCVGCPTIEEFLTSYKNEIAKLQADGRLVNVVDLDGTIAEQEPVECPSNDLIEFETVVYVTFNTTAEPSDEELEALERSFVESYNQANPLNGETCDLSFRVVENAAISMTDGNFVNVRNRRLKGKQSVYVSGSCRNFGERGPIAGDGCSNCPRALQSGIPVQKERPEWNLGDPGLLQVSRGLQDDDTDLNQCYCPIGNPEKRLPSIQELLTIYDRNIQFLVDEGVLTSVTSVDSIVEESKDSCNPNPCLNGGSCIDDIDGYTCTCLAGYEGADCDTNIDDCNANPCQNGGSCIDGVNDYTCSCLLDYTGKNCEIIIDDCSSNPCLNGGVCKNEVNGYTCSCLDGYSGFNCEVQIDVCNPNPCLNGGTCTDGVNTSTCTCPAGVSGDKCEIIVNNCSPTPCQNGGTCVDEADGFTCTCLPGFSGDICQTNNDDCSPNPCLNRGICTDGINEFTCNCPSGFTGAKCETNKDECDPNPCRNGGTCVVENDGFRCSCPVGYSGDQCEITLSSGGSSCEQALDLLANGSITTGSNENGSRTSFSSCDRGDVSGQSSWYSFVGTGRRMVV